MEMQRKKGLDTLWASSRYVWGRKGGQGVQVGMPEEDSLPNDFSVPPPIQGSFLIYPESEAVSFSEPHISRGVPQNRPIKLLVRVYVVKVSIHRHSTPPIPVKVMYMKATD